MFKTYPDALQYLYDNLPMFQRVGAVAYKKDLANTIKLCEVLGDPHKKFRSIHVAGTNGKGSTSHMLASVLQEAGYKTGLYTSPHLKAFTERIKINDEEISQQFVIDFVNKIHPVINEVQPSFFEITVAMAFHYFASQHIDVAVIEVGLGGRLDSTNIISPVISVITNIGWDHKDILGDSLEKIASEKAGIIKHRTPVVVSERQTDLEEIFIATAASKNAAIYFASDEYKVEARPSGKVNVYKYADLILSNLDLPLKGIYQHKNLPGVLKTIDVLNKNRFHVTLPQLQGGLERVIFNTGLKGRWQTLAEKPLVICDTGHNIDGIREIVKQISCMQFKHLHFVLGMVKDKDIQAVLALLPKQATYYFCNAKLPRALAAAALAEKAQISGLRGVVIPDVNEAKRMALKNASEDDLVFIGGSTFVVAEIEEL
jgi:dihydrofolate synthase / folylpolyglutamate synthase